ncbi:sulfatase-like hydrolase/transferase, partial [Candidatus Hydrogenedentota bacterium]
MISTRRDFIKKLGMGASAVAASTLLPPVATASAKKPNIVFLLIDDMGWMDSEPYGSKFYETPGVNRMAREGMLFTDAYAQPLCSPTRAAIMTGKYPSRLYLHQAITKNSKENPVAHTKTAPNRRMAWPESRNHLPVEERTIAEEMKDLGYKTWFLGKWHLGYAEKYYPKNQGFDKSIAVGGAGPAGGYFSPHKIPEIENGPDGEYICERLTDEACKLLEEGKKGKEPFFLYLAHFNVHNPYQAKPDLIEKFEKTMDPTQHQRNPIMAAMLYAMDQSVTRILEKIDELDLAKDTVVVFVSDNGGCHWDMADKKYRHVPITANLPLRGGKCSFWEGGVRVPMIIKWPGKIEPGSKSSTPVHSIDFYPTLLEIAGGKPSKDKILDGESILPVL